MTLGEAGASFAIARGFTKPTPMVVIPETMAIIMRHVPEGFEFLAVLATVVGSMSIMVLLGKWWER